MTMIQAPIAIIIATVLMMMAPVHTKIISLFDGGIPIVLWKYIFQALGEQYFVDKVYLIVIIYNCSKKCLQFGAKPFN